jgi:sterol desaturase/sphingolipid hydroxylase (fatty acid hydroxylase superfamily)
MSLAIIIGVSTVVVVLHDQAHTAFHLKGTPWNRFAWFQRLRALHFYHHRNMRKNMGTMSFVWDRVPGTFRKP